VNLRKDHYRVLPPGNLPPLTTVPLLLWQARPPGAAGGKLARACQRTTKPESCVV